jgi:hypothetical protein
MKRWALRTLLGLRTVAFTFGKLILFNGPPSHSVSPEDLFNTRFELRLSKRRSLSLVRQQLW